MGPAVALLCWLIALLVGLLVLWRPLPRGVAAAAAIIAALMTYGLSWFWRAAASAWWLGEKVPFAGPETAFLSLWALVALPVARQRLDRGWMWEVLRDGLVATAAIGLSVDIVPVITAILGGSAPGDAGARTVGVAVVSVLYLAGLALCLIASERRFPWEYIAWFSGVAVMVGTGHPTQHHLGMAAGHGLVAVAGAFIPGSCVAIAVDRRGAVAFLWTALGVLLPVIAAALYVSLGRGGP